MANERIWLSSPHMGAEEWELVKDVFETNWISTVGPHLQAFEKEIEKFLGRDHVTVLSSGTAAIHLALIMLGVERDDEVICSSLTFSGSCNPIRYQGALPVFVDSEKDTWNMDPSLLEEAIVDRIKVTGKKPKAIIGVHLYGMPAKIDELQTVAARYEIPLIEDAAEALGSRFKDRPLGTFGQIGIFSFNGNKIITTSGGGALVSSNKEVVERARYLATQARDPAPHYQHSVVGYNYRLSNVCAAIGVGQMRVLEERVRQRRAVFDFYSSKLAGVEAISFLPEPRGCFSNRWLTTLNIMPSGKFNRESLRTSLLEENVESRPIWKPMHQQPVFADCPKYINGASDELFDHGLCLPSGSNLTAIQMDRVSDLVLAAWLDR